MDPKILMPKVFTMAFSLVKASGNNGHSFRLPAAVRNGATTLQLRSQIATTLSPLWCLCPLRPRLSPPFLAVVYVPSPCRIDTSSRLLLFKDSTLAMNDAKIE